MGAPPGMWVGDSHFAVINQCRVCHVRILQGIAV